jgi:hypothetical protein
MVGFLSIGQQTIRWRLTAVRREGPFRLDVAFPGSPFVELFDTATAALVRLSQIDALMQPPPPHPVVERPLTTGERIELLRVALDDL